MESDPLLWTAGQGGLDDWLRQAQQLFLGRAADRCVLTEYTGPAPASGREPDHRGVRVRSTAELVDRLLDAGLDEAEVVVRGDEPLITLRLHGARPYIEVTLLLNAERAGGVPREAVLSSPGAMANWLSGLAQLLPGQRPRYRPPAGEFTEPVCAVARFAGARYRVRTWPAAGPLLPGQRGTGDAPRDALDCEGDPAEFGGQTGVLLHPSVHEVREVGTVRALSGWLHDVARAVTGKSPYYPAMDSDAKLPAGTRVRAAAFRDGSAWIDAAFDGRRIRTGGQPTVFAAQTAGLLDPAVYGVCRTSGPAALAAWLGRIELAAFGGPGFWQARWNGTPTGAQGTAFALSEGLFAAGVQVAARVDMLGTQHVVVSGVQDPVFRGPGGRARHLDLVGRPAPNPYPMHPAGLRYVVG